MLLDGCGSNFITLPYAFVCFDWFILHWWKWINIQSQQRCFYLWQMEFESVCCFKNLLLRNCHFFIGHYKAVFTHSRKQINCIFHWKFERKSPKLGSITTSSPAGAFWKIVYPSFTSLWKISSFPTPSVSFLFWKMFWKDNFLYLYANFTIACEYDKDRMMENLSQIWKLWPHYHATS